MTKAGACDRPAFRRAHAPEDVLSSLSLTKRDLFDNPRGATYRYDDGRIINRSPNKRFIQKDNTKGRPQLYHLSRLAEANDGSVFLVEGEKDVHAIESAGGVATCNPMGSKSFSKVDVEPLRGKAVTVVVDKDTSGAKWAAEVARRLDGLAARVRFVQAAVGKDAADHIVAAQPGRELHDWLPFTPDVSQEVSVRTEPDGPTLPSPGEPMTVAREMVRLHVRQVDEIPAWLWWRGEFYEWIETRWTVLPDATVEQWAYRNTEHAQFKEVGPRGMQVQPWAPTTAKVANLIHALGRGVLQRRHGLEPDDATGMVACDNGVYDTAADEMLPHSPSRFNLFSLPFAYEPGAECPHWLEFMATVFAHDPELARLLQQWFGYVLSGRTDLQKIASLVGPPRCGKGTIYRIMQALIGLDACASPEITKLAGQFGEQCLIGKRLATFSDVRWESRAAADAVQVLLAISGEDPRTIPRKNREDWNGNLPTRFMLMGNSEPSFNDSSGAMVGRLLHIQFKRSFLGEEDIGLTQRLLLELPGILRWAIEGLADLNKLGSFIEPQSSVEVGKKVSLATAPIKGFVQRHCRLSPGSRTSVDTLYEIYRHWCEKEGLEHPRVKSWFSRDLNAAYGHEPGFEIKTVRSDTERGQFVHGLAIEFDRHGNRYVSPL